MERQPKEPRWLRIINKVADWTFGTVEVNPSMPNHFKPSERIDVGKTERQARDVQLVLEGMSGYLGNSDPELLDEWLGRLNRPDDQP